MVDLPLRPAVLILGLMALLVTVVLALTCLGGLAAPGPVPHSMALKELIEELVNITQDQKVSVAGWCLPSRGHEQAGPVHLRVGKKPTEPGLGPAMWEKDKPGWGVEQCGMDLWRGGVVW
jgi:hypothetical protein